MSEIEKVVQSGIYKKELEELKQDAENRWSKNENNTPTLEDITAYNKSRTDFLQEKIDSGDLQKQIEILFETASAIQSKKIDKSIDVFKNGSVADILANASDKSNDDIFFNCIKIASDFNHIKAILELAHCYKYKTGVEQNPVEEIYCYKRASDLGSADAMYEMAGCFKEGIAVKPNLEIAIYWLHKSAKANNIKAIKELCTCYENGDNVPQNHEIAIYFGWCLISIQRFFFNDDVPSSVYDEIYAILNAKNEPKNLEIPKELAEKYSANTAPQNGDKKLMEVIFHLTPEGKAKELNERLAKRAKTNAKSKKKREVTKFVNNIFKK